MNIKPPIDRSRCVACATDIVGHFEANMSMQVLIETFKTYSTRFCETEGVLSGLSCIGSAMGWFGAKRFQHERAWNQL